LSKVHNSQQAIITDSTKSVISMLKDKRVSQTINNWVKILGIGYSIIRKKLPVTEIVKITGLLIG